MSLDGSPASLRPVRLGLVGLGRAAAMHVDALARVAGSDLVAFCDPRSEARLAGRGHGLSDYPTLHAMISAEEIDGLIISSPPATHHPLAIEALESGLHVLCEKPLSLAWSTGYEMVECARRRGRVLMLAAKFRHERAISRTRKLIASGRIGEPLLFEIGFCSPVDMASRWNANPAASGGGVIIDNACHAFGVISHLFGDIAGVRASVWRPLQRIPVEDSASVEVRCASGVLGRVDVSWSVARTDDRYLTILGSNGAIEIGWSGARYRSGAGGWQSLSGPYDKAAAHRSMHRAFRDLIRGRRFVNRSLLAVHTLSDVSCVDAAYRSLRSGQWESVEGAHPRPLARERRTAASAPDDHAGARAAGAAS